MRFHSTSTHQSVPLCKFRAGVVCKKTVPTSFLLPPFGRTGLPAIVRVALPCPPEIGNSIPIRLKRHSHCRHGRRLVPTCPIFWMIFAVFRPDFWMNLAVFRPDFWFCPLFWMIFAVFCPVFWIFLYFCIVQSISTDGIFQTTYR